MNPTGRQFVDGALAWSAGPEPQLHPRPGWPLAVRHEAPGPCLHFNLSPDEEHAWLCVEWQGACVDLGERVHHYLLVTLARQRQADANAGRCEASRGWLAMDSLARMLGHDPAHINIQVFRARRHLALAVPAEWPMAGVIERRRGEVRFGALAFSLRRGMHWESRPPVAPTLAPTLALDRAA